MNENQKRLIEKIADHLREFNLTTITEGEIQERFGVGEDDARRALFELNEQFPSYDPRSEPLQMCDDGSFRYAPPFPPYNIVPPSPNAPEERLGDEPLRTTVPPNQFYVQDLERILYSSAFRRLAGVTQVFETSRGHVAHNRLTHSIKVGHIARTIATGLNDPKFVNPDVVEAAALAHDLGHPPFGHAGEKALDECVTAAGLDDGFEGNAQTFRILTKLSTSKGGQAGLNLTRRVLNAVLKYPWMRGQPGERSHRKWSVYRSEEAEFRFVRSGPTTEEKSVDAKVMDLADDIAYAVHDIEDAVRARMIPIDGLLKEGPQREEFLEFVKQTSKKDKDGRELDRSEVETVLNLLKSCESPLRFKPYEDSREQRGALRRITTILHKRYVLAARKGPDGNLLVEERFKTELRVLKYLMRHFVFCALEREHETIQKPIVEKLFSYFLDFARSDPKLLPVPARWALESICSTALAARNEARIRAAADAVAGLTEQEGMSLVGRLETGIPRAACLLC